MQEPLTTSPLKPPALAPKPAAPIEGLPPVPANDSLPPAPAKPAEPKPGKPFSWSDDFKQLDRNKDGKLSKSELKLKAAKTSDLDKNGTVDLREFRHARLRENSFEGLDADGNGTLDATELAKMRRFDDRQYGDGQTITKAEFLKTRQAELNDNRTAKLKARFKEGLSPEEAKKMQRFAGKDGKLSAEEYVQGRRQRWREWHAERRDKLFERAGGEHGTLDVTTKEGKRYAAYDADHDGKVSKAEFKQGYQADLKQVWKARLADGNLDSAAVRARLAYGRDSFANEIKMPAKREDTFANREKWFISQYGTKYNTREDVPGYDNANCGPTSLTMVAKAFGKIDPSPAEADAAIEKTRAMMGDGTSQYHGTSAEGIARGAAKYGLDAKIVNNIGLGAIQAELQKGRLPIINGNLIRPDGSIGGGHFFVVTKIEGGKAYLNDPASKTGPTVVSTDKLMQSVNSHWSHRLISIGPGK